MLFKDNQLERLYEIQKNVATGKEYITLTVSNALPARLYRMYMSIGYLDGNGNFVAIGKPGLTGFEAKKPNFYVNQIVKVKMPYEEGSSQVCKLTGKGFGDQYTVKALHNTNVNGKPNQFTEYVGISSDGKTLVFHKNGSVKKSDIQKGNLTGYAECEVAFDDGTTKTEMIKVTITLQ